MNSTPITSVQNILKIKSNCYAILKKHGVKVGNTIERAVSGQWFIPPDLLQGLIDNLKLESNPLVLIKLKTEYNDLEKVAISTCTEEFKRDINGRRAIIAGGVDGVIKHCCISYQHFFIRQWELNHIVHFRSQDIRKMLEDIWLLLRTEQAIIKLALPDDVKIKKINLYYSVDCFHEYLEPLKVPL